jgi:hypothetical protein
MLGATTRAYKYKEGDLVRADGGRSDVVLASGTNLFGVNFGVNVLS